MRILVTGGAGYVGSFAVRTLLTAGHQVVVLDNISTGHAAAVGDAKLIRGSVENFSDVRYAFLHGPFACVMHFAARTEVGESMASPSEYYRTNVLGGLVLLDVMREFGCSKFVFSSSCAIYGNPSRMPITERQHLSPVSVYGRTKLVFERLLGDYSRAYGISYASLRYFNAAGASQDGSLGEDHRPESHLIPRILRVAMGREEAIEVYGTDYDTPDGTCIRDFVHVSDISSAHALVAERLGDDSRNPQGAVYNIGSEMGHSVREVIEAARRVTGRKIVVREVERRPGDPPRLVASSRMIRRDLGWSPEHSSLEEIVETAWRWHLAYPDGVPRPGSVAASYLAW